MKKNAMLFGFVLVGALLLAGNLAAAQTYSLVDAKYLPVTRVYDPVSGQRELITTYSFERLDTLMWTAPGFLRWNDGRKVCESMQLMFGKVSDRCLNLPTPLIVKQPVKRYVSPTLSSVPEVRVQPVQLRLSHESVAVSRPRSSVVIVRAADPLLPYGQHIYSPYG